MEHGTSSCVDEVRDSGMMPVMAIRSASFEVHQPKGSRAAKRVGR